MKTNMPLFNLQLAATHVAFMLDHDSSGKVRDVSSYLNVMLTWNARMSQIFPNHPILSRPQTRCLCSCFIFDWYSYFAPRCSNDSSLSVVQFEALLASLDRDQRYDHLRLALQVAVLLSPIFLLQEILIHKSKLYCQRHRVILVCGPFLNHRLCWPLIISILNPLEMHGQNQSLNSKMSSGELFLTSRVVLLMYMLLLGPFRMPFPASWTT